jgi:acetoin utilization deacetylase AcuC-like enzyme
VHHGNGTQWMFYGDPRVLYVSTHQFPFYPGTGAADEVGSGEGAGFTVNIPLEAGATDTDYDAVYRDAVAPVLREFHPQLVIVSAGFDAHERDPLAQMRVTEAGYGSIVSQLMRAAPGGAIAFVTEGGYDLVALASCLDETFTVVLGRGEPAPPGQGAAAPRAQRALATVRRAQGRFWRCLAASE